MFFAQVHIDISAPKKKSGSPPRRRAPNADLRWAGREWSFHQKLKTTKRVLVNLVDFGIFTYMKTIKINQMYRSVNIPKIKCCELWLVLGAMIQKHHLVHKEWIISHLQWCRFPSKIAWDRIPTKPLEEVATELLDTQVFCGHPWTVGPVDELKGY